MAREINKDIQDIQDIQGSQGSQGSPTNADIILQLFCYWLW